MNSPDELFFQLLQKILFLKDNCMIGWSLPSLEHFLYLSIRFTQFFLPKLFGEEFMSALTTVRWFTLHIRTA